MTVLPVQASSRAQEASSHHRLPTGRDEQAASSSARQQPPDCQSALSLETSGYIATLLPQAVRLPGLSGQIRWPAALMKLLAPS